MKQLIIMITFTFSGLAFSSGFGDRKQKIIQQIEEKIDLLSKQKQLSPYSSKLKKQIAKLKDDKKCAKSAANDEQLNKCNKNSSGNSINKGLKKFGL